VSLSPAQQARNELGVAIRKGDADLIEEARAELRTARAEQMLRRLIQSAPPLSEQRLARLRMLLHPEAGSE
jgi:hypothetical protein